MSKVRLTTIIITAPVIIALFSVLYVQFVLLNDVPHRVCHTEENNFKIISHSDFGEMHKLNYSIKDVKCEDGVEYYFHDFGTRPIYFFIYPTKSNNTCILTAIQEVCEIK